MTDPDDPKPMKPAEGESPAPLPPARVVSDRTDAPGDQMPEGDEEPPRGARAMAIVRWGLVALMALVALFALNSTFGWFGGGGAGESSTTYYCPMHPGQQQDHPGECPICSRTLVPKPKPGDIKAEEAAKAQMAGQAQGSNLPAAGSGAYYCPMHPEVTSDDPHAKCPKCGMKLEPNPAAGSARPAAAGSATPAMPPATAQGVPGLAPVTLSHDRIQLMGMHTAQVRRDTLASELRTVGTVAANEKGLAVIQTRFAGWIEDLKVEQTGQQVHKGQVLATIYSPELLAAQQEYLNAIKWSKSSAAGQPSDLSIGLGKDARRRLELLGISGSEIDALERNGEPARALAIRSPVSGYVIEKGVLQGSQVQPGSTLFQVADLSTVWVLADVYEYEIGRVELGQPARITFVAYPGEEFTGKLTFIYPSLNSSTRTLRVRLELKNPKLRLRPGMYGDVTIQLARAEVLVGPREAIVDTGVVQYVFVARPGGRFEPRKVKLGARAGDKVAVLEGLAEGETVVTTANFLLDSESHLQATIQGEAGAGAPAPPGDFCEAELDKQKFPDKHQQCVACRAHRGMGSMEEDCRKQIPKPWK